MRVKHKYQDSEEFEVLDESSKYYIVRNATGQSIALDKLEWGLAAQWHDKSEEKNGKQAAILLRTDPTHYRLVQHTVDNLQEDRKFKAYLLEWNGGL